MSLDTPVESLASAVYDAKVRLEVNHPHLLEAYHFPQLWSSTALGFGGIGGQSMTSAYTTVVIGGRSAAVYFNGRHAYTVERPDYRFHEDMRKHYMAPVSDHKKYERV